MDRVQSIKMGKDRQIKPDYDRNTCSANTSQSSPGLVVGREEENNRSFVPFSAQLHC